MTEKEKNKKRLLQKCFDLVNEKLKQIEQVLASLQNDLLTATKSSAGDKHETSRAMLQLEMEKKSQQLSAAKTMYNTLCTINLNKNVEKASLGSVVTTTKGIYFLGVSLGKIPIANIDFLVVSTQSPIGKSLLGKNSGESISFNNSIITEIY